MPYKTRHSLLLVVHKPLDRPFQFYSMLSAFRQGCPLSPVLSEKDNTKDFVAQWQSDIDKYPDNSEEDAEVYTSLRPVAIGRRPLCNLRFADDIDLLGGSEEKLQQLTENLEKTAVGLVGHGNQL